MRSPAFAPLRISLAILLLLIQSGCGSSGPTAPPAPVTSLTLRQVLNAVTPAAVHVPANIDTTASLLFSLHLYAPLKGAGAAFENGGLVSAGNVWIRTMNGAALDSTALVQASGIAAGHSYVVYGTMGGTPAVTINIPFDGVAFHVFDVAGSASIPAFIDSIQSVHDIDVTAPIEGAAVTRASGLPVTWGDAGADAAVKVAATVIANSDTTLKAAAAAVDDPTAGLTIPAAALTKLPAGGAKLAVTRYRLVYKSESGHPTGFVCETIEVRNLTLN